MGLGRASAERERGGGGGGGGSKVVDNHLNGYTFVVVMYVLAG